MSSEERESLLDADGGFKKFRLLGLAHGVLGGIIALSGLAYFCTILALAGTDTNAANMALFVLVSLSACVALTGTAVVAQNFRPTNTRLKCITAVYIGQSVLNMLLAMLVVALGSASIKISAETTQLTPVVTVPVLFMLFGVLMFAASVANLLAVFFRFPASRRKKVSHKAYKVFTVSKTSRRTPSPPPTDGSHESDVEKALEAEGIEKANKGGHMREDSDNNHRRSAAKAEAGASSKNESTSAKQRGSQSGDNGARKEEAGTEKPDREPRSDSTAEKSNQEVKSTGDMKHDDSGQKNNSRANDEGSAAHSLLRAKNYDERFFISVDAPPVRGNSPGGSDLARQRRSSDGFAAADSDEDLSNSEEVHTPSSAKTDIDKARSAGMYGRPTEQEPSTSGHIAERNLGGKALRKHRRRLR